MQSMMKRIAVGWLVGAAALIAHAPARPAARASGSENPAAAASFAEFDRRARAGESLEVVFFGASLTWGANASDPLRTSYRAEVARRLERDYPQARFRFHDAAIGGTGSQLGVFRLDRDVLAHEPDLVFLDFSANDDIASDSPETLASYEAILRRLVGEARVPVVQVVFPFKWNVAAKSTAGMKRRDAHLALAAAYGTAVGDAITLAIDRVGRGETTLEALWPVDGVHPCDEGYQLFADAAWDAFQAAVRDGKVCRLPTAMLHANTYMRAVRQPLCEQEPLPSGWRAGRPNLTAANFDFLMSRWLDGVVIASRPAAEPAAEPPPPARLRARFTGRMVMVFGETTKASGKYRVWIDGKPVEHVCAWTKENTDLFDVGAFARRIGGNGHHAQVIATGLYGSVEHLLEIEPVLELGEELRLESLCVAGPDAAVTLASATRADMVDVVVYGGTPAGIAAALAAADDGSSVLLVEPTPRVGGLLTSGLSHTDYHAFDGLTGTFLDFAKRVERHYADAYGKDSPQVKDSFRGTFGEPSVNLKVLEAMLAERKRATVERSTRLVAVATADGGTRLASARFARADGTELVASAAVFVDATYEGDLMAAAGVPWRVGREGKDKYGESRAPEQPDGEVQAYNFRFVMTREPDNRVTVQAPPGYDRTAFLDVLDVIKEGKLQAVFGYPSGCAFKAQVPPLPNGKYDINDVSGSAIRLSLPGMNTAWPDGDEQARGRVFAAHLRDQWGLLYFLQNDDAVPRALRDEAREWGWCKDEFADTNHLPPRLYVREARRMEGMDVFSQRDSAAEPGDARAVLHRDAIAFGEYGNNCHGTGHEGPRFGGRHTGEFYSVTPPYQIPYGVIVPQVVENLLVPCAVSASHVGFCGLRLEPIWASLGQASGHAAHLARVAKLPVQQVPVPRLQARLHRAGAGTVYVSDVLPGHTDFAAVQWWGTAGGLHGLLPAPQGGPRGKLIVGQYHESYPSHAAELGKVLDAALAERWRNLAHGLKLPAEKLPVADGTLTRGDWVRAAFSLSR
jgi:lysophospholipase L1-like esterase